MEQAPDRSGRQAFKITMFGCLGIVAAFFVVIFAMIACTAMFSAPEEKKDRGAKAAVLELVGTQPAEAHRQFITLHNGRDYSQVQEHHHRIVVCDGSNNNHLYGTQVRFRGGSTRTVFDFGAGQKCASQRFDRRIQDIRWVCDEGYGRWRRA